MLLVVFILASNFVFKIIQLLKLSFRLKEEVEGVTIQLSHYIELPSILCRYAQ